MHEFLIGEKLYNAFNGRINIDSANTDFITRIGTFVKYEDGAISYMSEPAIQFSLATCNEGKTWNVGEGPAISLIEEKYNLTFENAIEELTKKIELFANKFYIKFNLMLLPRHGIESCILEIYKNIVIRYMADYMPSSDIIIKRFDIIIIRRPKNA